MRIIIDNNQVAPLCQAIRRDIKVFRGTVAILSSYAIAEILLAPRGREKASILSQLTLRFGEEVATVLNDVAVRTDARPLATILCYTVTPGHTACYEAHSATPREK